MVNGSEAHPNNRFVVYFYDATGNYLGETDMFNQHGQYLDEDNIDVAHEIGKFSRNQQAFDEALQIKEEYDLLKEKGKELNTFFLIYRRSLL